MQFTEEKLGKAERTENDPHFENLARKTDKTKGYTEKLVKDTEAVLVPNPGENSPDTLAPLNNVASPKRLLMIALSRPQPLA